MFTTSSKKNIVNHDFFLGVFSHSQMDTVVFLHIPKSNSDKGAWILSRFDNYQMAI